LMPLVRSNSGNSCSYAPANPPDIKTFNATSIDCADASTGQMSSVAKTTTIVLVAFVAREEKVFKVSSSPRSNPPC
jgi:hypothetical protein